MPRFPLSNSPRRSTTRTSGSGCAVARSSQSHQCDSSVHRRGIALQRRRRAAEHEQSPLVTHSFARHRNGVIARHSFLLVGRIVRFVDDQQADVGRAARTPRCALRRRRRSLRARTPATHRSVRDPRAPNAGPRRVRRRPPRIAAPPAALARSPARARSLAALAHHALDRLDVDERLAASGHAVQQRRIEFAPVERRVDPLLALAACSVVGCAVCSAARSSATRRRAHVSFRQCAGSHGSRDHGAAESRQQRVGARRRPHVSRTNADECLGLLSSDRAVAGLENSDAVFAGARVNQTTLASQRARPHERSSRDASSAPRSAARRASGWRSSCSSVKPSASSSQIKRSNRAGTDGYRCGFGCAAIRDEMNRACVGLRRRARRRSAPRPACRCIAPR